MRKVKVKYPKDQILHSRKIPNISNWKELNREWRGSRDKVILVHPETGSFFLVKFPKYGSNEMYYELFNCYFGKSLGLNYADYYLCHYNKKLGIASKSFVNLSNELWEMKDLICRYSSTDKLELRYGRDTPVLKEHYIDYIVMILKDEFGESVLPDFFRMIAFDCLTGHGDRHWENYGVLLVYDRDEDVRFRFAPIYDTANGYLLEMTDEKLKGMFKSGELDNPSWYDPKIKGLCKITLEGNIKSSHIDLFKYIFKNDEFFKYRQFMIEILNAYDRKLVSAILSRKPFSSGLQKMRKDAIIKVLAMRHKILMNVVKG